MSVVAIRGSVIATDGLIGMSNFKIGSTPKLFRILDGFVGLAGNIGDFRDVLEWLANGLQWRMNDHFPDREIYKRTSGLVLLDSGEVWEILEGKPMRYDARYFAAGSGAPFAFGAMHAGASAVDAVKAAITHEDACGGPYYWADIGLSKKVFSQHEGNVTMKVAA